MTQEEAKTKVLQIANEDLTKGIYYYSALIYPSPKKLVRLNAFNKYGQLKGKNENYAKQLMAWKERVFTFFTENGFFKAELNDAWKNFKNRK